MKNKKGFTLVELLAVIAILAILMLLIMPNVLSMFNSGKKDTFKVQIDSLIKTAMTQKQTDELSGKIYSSYCESDSMVCSKLSTTDGDAKYKIKFNSSNKITSIALSNSNYCYINNSYNANINDNGFIEGAELVCTESGCYCVGGDSTYKFVYWTTTQGGSGTSYSKTQKPSTTYNTVEELGLTSPGKYIRTVVDTSGNTKGHEVCLLYNSKSYCFGTNYHLLNDENSPLTKEKLKADMEKKLGTARICSNGVDSNGNDRAYCSYGSGYCHAVDTGRVVCNDGSSSCYVLASGTAACH